MTRLINKTVRIEFIECSDCLYKEHFGAGGGRVAYIPNCTLEGKEIPYEELAQNGRVYASIKPGIPDWCPLLTKEEKAMSGDKTNNGFLKRAEEQKKKEFDKEMTELFERFNEIEEKYKQRLAPILISGAINSLIEYGENPSDIKTFCNSTADKLFNAIKSEYPH